jgi:pimeloyl-ACP methyl ester carboxylesterase
MNGSRRRRWTLRVVALAGFLALAGVTYQGVATALERREFPRPGRMVDVGGHQLHIDCKGQGEPIVVLDASAAGLSAAWGRVQPEVARLTRVCSYDRAGLGWSESREQPFGPQLAVEELHRLLAGAKEKGPFVLAGQGLGASLVQTFASTFPAETAGLVLVDLPALDRAAADGALLVRLPRLTPWLARVGILRGFRLHERLADGLPDPSRGALATFLNRPDHLTRSARELLRWNDVVAAGANAQLPPQLPVRRVDTAAAGRIAFLTGEADAARVNAAIQDTVRALRPAPPAPR